MSENQENVNVSAAIKELKSAIEYPDNLTYNDIKEKINLAYKIAGIYSQDTDTPEEVGAKRNEELSKIIIDLGQLAKTKQADEINAREVKQSQQLQETEKETKPESNSVIEEKHNTVPEVTVKSAVSSTEPTKEQIETAIKMQKEPTMNVNVVVNAVKKEEVDNKSEITVGQYKDATVLSSNDTPEQSVNQVKEIETVKSVETEKTEMEIESPSSEEQHILISDDKDIASNEENPGANNDYSFLENKPFEGDDDLDNADADLSNIIIEDKPSEKELREQEITKEFSVIPEGMQMMNVKAISRKKESDTLKALSKISTNGVDIGKVAMFDYNDGDENIRREYLKTRNDLIATPKLARIALLMSGHYEEMSSYSNYDLVSVERNISNPDISFVNREMIMLNSIYNHVKYVSYANEKPSFEEWTKNIMYPDISSLYFGVYDANSVGDNNYTFGCPFCGENVTIARANRDLTVAVPKEFTRDQLDKFITTKDIMKLNSTEIARWAKNTIVKKMLHNSKIIVEYAVPTLYDYLVVLNTAERISKRDLGDTLDLSAIDIFNSEGNEDDATRILGYMYVKSICIPSQVSGTNRFRYIRLSSKADIIEHINGLDMDDYREIFTGKQVQDLIIRSATKYFIENVECTNCKKTVPRVSLDPKQIFFFKIGKERSSLI